MLMNYARACNPYSGLPAPVNGTSTIGHAEKSLFSGFSRHVLHYRLRIKDGRKIDPACGTGSFGAEIIKYIKNTYFSGSKAAFYEGYIQEKDGLLSRLIAFEIMMTSYVVAHLKIRRTIDATLGHTPEEQLPTNIFLTNTLAPPVSSLERGEQLTLFDFSAAITDEAYHADTWKARRPIKVIIGKDRKSVV